MRRLLVKKNPRHNTQKFAVPVKRRGVAGHEEQDVGGLRPAGVTQCVKVRHDIQGASLVDQASVESCRKVADQQDRHRGSAPHFQIGQRYPCGRQAVKRVSQTETCFRRCRQLTAEDHAEGQHRVDEPELFVGKQTDKQTCLSTFQLLVVSKLVHCVEFRHLYILFLVLCCDK